MRMFPSVASPEHWKDYRQQNDADAGREQDPEDEIALPALAYVLDTIECPKDDRRLNDD
jgi:hypothetical protein